MQRDIGKQDKPAGQTQLTNAEREFAPRRGILDLRHDVFPELVSASAILK